MPVFLLFAYHIATMPALLQLVYQTQLVVNRYFPLKPDSSLMLNSFLVFSFWAGAGKLHRNAGSMLVWLGVTALLLQGKDFLGMWGSVIPAAPW